MTERPIRATIRDVARLAGVSVATVSRVLNKSGYVKEETRFRIEAAIRQCNYRPNEAARSLIGSNSGLVSVIMPSRLNPFFSEIMDAVERTAEQRSAKLTEAPGNHAKIGGLKVTTKDNWFAARPSGTENIYKVYAESFESPEALDKVLAEAEEVVDKALGE